ncbi:membrane-associated progesterone receptor component 1 [Drosophila bipectinata]|uniref:membrane-associated progesterone receptor component 1 n=1 Tax=Drosophila bipectinata TaxID=42026 RepID=UPI001C8A4FF0|nr:membrane-associated progesterone receptor component 1 [Drosophila bipectinata]
MEVEEISGDYVIVVGVVLTLIVGILSYVCAYVFDFKSKKAEQVDLKKNLAPRELPALGTIKLTLDQLLGYDGTRSDGRILVGLKGKIYDVSSDLQEFGLGGTLSHVAGRDFTNYLNHIMRSNQTQTNYVDRWEAILETNYSCVGFIVDERGKPLVEGTKIMDDEDQDAAVPETNIVPNEVLETEPLPAAEVDQKSLENPMVGLAAATSEA